jgi:hypothetical protein
MAKNRYGGNTSSKKTDFASKFTHSEAAKAKGNYKETAINVVTDLASAAVGATAGSYVGKHAAVVGVALVLVGYMFDVKPAVAGGLGMTFGAVTSEKSGATGKERVSQYFNDIQEKFYMSPAPATKPAGTAGLGNLGYLPITANAGFQNKGGQMVMPSMQRALPSSQMYGVESGYPQMYGSDNYSSGKLQVSFMGDEDE